MTATNKEKWFKQTLKLQKILKNSGLWSNYLEDVRLALSIGYEKLQECNKISQTKFKDSYTENQKIIVQKIKEIEPRLIKINTETNHEYLDSSLLWHFCDIPKIKKMYFGKCVEYKLTEIKEAIQKKQKIETSGRSNYDVGFEYNPTENKAWYREEYKNCGNGHYYLAISETHAVFYEDD